MPRSNLGTLLENIVVLEAARLGLTTLPGQSAMSFASSFAMPPLTQTVATRKEAARYTTFNNASVTELSRHPIPGGSLKQFISLCRANLPGVPVCGYRTTTAEDTVYPAGGPNGALLAAMLACQLGRTIHLWLNDDGGRYGEVPPATPNSLSESPRTLAHAGALVGGTACGTVTHTADRFPDTIADLRAWLDRPPASDCPVRVGFLDPDTYLGEKASVSPEQHQYWLTSLAAGCDRVLSVLFFSCRDRGTGHVNRNRLVAEFHADQLSMYPNSLVFQSTNRPVAGNFMTGVKVRWPAESIGDVTRALTDAVSSAYAAWGSLPTPLLVHQNGQP